MTGHSHTKAALREVAFDFHPAAQLLSERGPGAILERVLAKHHLCAYPVSCFVSRLWVPVTSLLIDAVM